MKHPTYDIAALPSIGLRLWRERCCELGSGTCTRPRLSPKVSVLFPALRFACRRVRGRLFHTYLVSVMDHSCFAV